MNELDRFINDPGASANPALAASLIAPGLMPDVARRLLTSPRTARRASRLLAQQFGDGDPATLDPADLSLLSGDAGHLEDVAAAAGCVWHARRIRGLIANADIAAFVTRFGSGARELALRHSALAAGDTEGDDLHADIARDGAGCIAAWISTLPGWAANRMRLIWAEQPVPADADICARIVRAVAGDV